MNKKNWISELQNYESKAFLLFMLKTVVCCASYFFVETMIHLMFLHSFMKKNIYIFFNLNLFKAHLILAMLFTVN